LLLRGDFILPNLNVRQMEIHNSRVIPTENVAKGFLLSSSPSPENANYQKKKLCKKSFGNMLEPLTTGC